jgi:replicative DNA helicase
MGVKELDAEGLGPTRKELFMIGGVYGAGKSFGLLHVAISTLLLSHQDVILYPCEMSEERCCARVAAMMFNYTSSARKERFNRLIKDNEGRIIDFEPDFIRTECSFANEGDLLKKVEGLQRRPKLIIKAFPSNTFTMQRCEAHQDALLAKEGIQAGLVLTDYAGVMQIKNPAHKRLEIGAHVVEMRRVAAERNQAHGSAMQLNRGGMTGQARGVHAAEDISVLHTADNAFIYNATESEKQLGLARIFVDKARNGKGGFEVLISQAYGAGKWKIGSSLMHSNYQKLLKGDEDDEGDG